MTSWACPFCGSDEIEEKDIYLRIYYRRVSRWNEDGTPAEYGEGAWGDVEHLEEDLGVSPKALEPSGRFICVRCDRSFPVPDRAA
jgi:hypothetical protein